MACAYKWEPVDVALIPTQGCIGSVKGLNFFPRGGHPVCFSIRDLGNSFISLKCFINHSNMAQRKRAGLITRRSLDRNEVLLFFLPYYVRAHDSAYFGVCNKVFVRQCKLVSFCIYGRGSAISYRGETKGKKGQAK